MLVTWNSSIFCSEHLSSQKLFRIAQEKFNFQGILIAIIACQGGTSSP